MDFSSLLKAVDALSPQEKEMLRQHLLSLDAEKRRQEAEIEADEALWDQQFAQSQDFLVAFGRQIRAEYDAGLTDEFDPDVDAL